MNKTKFLYTNLIEGIRLSNYKPEPDSKAVKMDFVQDYCNKGTEDLSIGLSYGLNSEYNLSK